jgi:hypothetical protein
MCCAAESARQIHGLSPEALDMHATPRGHCGWRGIVTFRAKERTLSKAREFHTAAVDAVRRFASVGPDATVVGERANQPRTWRLG